MSNNYLQFLWSQNSSMFSWIIFYRNFVEERLFSVLICIFDRNKQYIISLTAGIIGDWLCQIRDVQKNNLKLIWSLCSRMIILRLNIGIPTLGEIHPPENATLVNRCAYSSYNLLIERILEFILHLCPLFLLFLIIFFSRIPLNRSWIFWSNYSSSNCTLIRLICSSKALFSLILSLI